MAMGAGRRVLVVDDDESMREAIESLLAAAGFDTAMYASAEALLAGGAIEGAACVISDLKLGAMSGFELLAELRGRGALLPVIVITAHDAPDMADRADAPWRSSLSCQALHRQRVAGRHRERIAVD